MEGRSKVGFNTYVNAHIFDTRIAYHGGLRYIGLGSGKVEGRSSGIDVFARCPIKYLRDERPRARRVVYP